MTTNLIHDLSTLTTISASTLDNLNDKAIWCMCDAVEKAVLAGEQKTIIDIGYGQLLIAVDGDQIKYKFIPGNELVKAINSTVTDGHNPLVFKLEQSLYKKMTDVVKDFF